MRIERDPAGGVIRLVASAPEARRFADILLDEAYDHRPVVRLQDSRLEFEDGIGLVFFKRLALDPGDLVGELERVAGEWRWALHPGALAALGGALESLERGFAELELGGGAVRVVEGPSR